MILCTSDNIFINYHLFLTNAHKFNILENKNQTLIYKFNIKILQICKYNNVYSNLVRGKLAKIYLQRCADNAQTQTQLFSFSNYEDL